MTKKLITAGVVVVLAAMLAGLGYVAKAKFAAAPAYNCTAGPGEMCASPQFVDDVDRANALSQEVISLTRSNAPMLTLQAKQDQLRGMSERLSDEMRATVGPNKETVNRWDDKKRVLILNPLPAPLPVPKPVAVAPVPAKKP